MTNLLGMIFTLGLFYPWARIRRMKYQFESMSLETVGSLDTLRGIGRRQDLRHRRRAGRVLRRGLRLLKTRGRGDRGTILRRAQLDAACRAARDRRRPARARAGIRRHRARCAARRRADHRIASGSTPRRLRFDDGAVFETLDNDGMDRRRWKRPDRGASAAWWTAGSASGRWRSVRCSAVVCGLSAVRALSACRSRKRCRACAAGICRSRHWRAGPGSARQHSPRALELSPSASQTQLRTRFGRMTAHVAGRTRLSPGAPSQAGRSKRERVRVA